MRRLPLAVPSFLLLAVVWPPAPPPAGAALIIVPDQAPTIQDAITAAASGDSILVRAGTYAESLTLSGKDVTIFGESGAAATILSGNSVFRILEVSGPGVTTATVLADLTFRDGKALQGGGIRMSGGASLTVRRCRFIGNQAVGNPCGAAGGAVMLGQGSSLVVEQSLFDQNEAFCLDLTGDGSGGAIDANADSRLEVRGSEFVDNTTGGFEGGFGGAINVEGSAIIEDCRFSGGFGWYGGGVRAGVLWIEGGGGPGGVRPGPEHASRRSVVDVVIRGCVFERNQAWIGAAIYGELATMTVEHNTFYGNHAWAGLAAVVVVTYAQGRIAHNTLSYNEAAGIGLSMNQPPVVVSHNIVSHSYGQRGVVAYPAPPAGSIACNDVWGNTQGNYGGDCPDLTGIDGNISADPLFCDAPARDFTLDARSPCAPALSPPGCGLIGAWPVACGMAAADDAAPAPPLRLAVHPNPISRSATFTLAAGAGTLEIHDGSGRLVASLPARGRRVVDWIRPSDLPAGIYFATLTSRAGQTETIKIAVLR